MAEIAIRDMRAEDYEAYDRFAGLLHRMHQEARPDLFSSAEHPFPREYFEKCLQTPGLHLLLAEVDGLPAGMCVFELRDFPRDPLMLPIKQAYVNDIFVAEEFRRLGVGHALYRETERRAKALGAETLSLTVWEFNESALGFYRKLGMNVRYYQMEAKL